MQAAYNVAGFDVGDGGGYPRMPVFAWKNGLGELIALDCVILGSRTGWSGNTGDIQAIANADYTGEIVTRIKRNRREISFRIPVRGKSLADREALEQKIISAFAQSIGTGRLYFTRQDGTCLYLDATPARGCPSIDEVTDRFSWADITLVAVSPNWTLYGEPYRLIDGYAHNPGNVPAEVSFVATADEVINETTGQTISAATGQTIVGITISVTDNSISATGSGGSNEIWKFSADSEFWMIAPGTNQIAGTSDLQFRPRWDGV